MTRTVRAGLWFTLLSLLLAGCAASSSRFIAIPPTVVPDPLHRSDSRLIQNPPTEILSQFTLNAKGYIVDGPRSRPGEPVDHTALMTNDAIAESFAKVALGSSEGSFLEFTHPDGTEFRDSLKGKVTKYRRDLGQVILYRGGIITARLYEALDRSVKLISENTGLSISMQGGRAFEETLGFSFVKDQRDMASLASFIRDLAKEEVPDSDRHQAILTLANTLEFFVTEDLASCFGLAGADDSGALGSAFIVFYLSISEKQLESCAYEETIQSMGLFNDDNSLFNTMFTDAFKEYLFPTELDWMMLRILYDERIKTGMTQEEAMPIVREILTESRPHGDL